jgi:hypothetical protein
LLYLSWILIRPGWQSADPALAGAHGFVRLIGAGADGCHGTNTSDNNLATKNTQNVLALGQKTKV